MKVSWMKTARSTKMKGLNPNIRERTWAIFYYLKVPQQGWATCRRQGRHILKIISGIRISRNKHSHFGAYRSCWRYRLGNRLPDKCPSVPWSPPNGRSMRETKGEANFGHRPTRV